MHGQYYAQVVSEFENGTKARSYAYGSYVDEPLVMVDHKDSDARYFYHRNHLYSVSAITDASGLVSRRYGYGAYGQQEVVADAAGTALDQAYGFTGRRFDRENGLYYYRTRYYSAANGRFLNRMPWWSQRGAVSIQGMAFLVLDPQWKMLVRSSLASGHGSYLQGRMNLYDFNTNDPANQVEPFSTTELVLGVGFGGDRSDQGSSLGITGWDYHQPLNDDLTLFGGASWAPTPDFHAGLEWRFISHWRFVTTINETTTYEFDDYECTWQTSIRYEIYRKKVWNWDLVLDAGVGVSTHLGGDDLESGLDDVDGLGSAAGLLGGSLRF